jgi:putative membrane protein
LVPPHVLLALRERPTGPFLLDWGIHPSVLIGSAIFAGLYFYGITTWRRRHAPTERVAAWQVLSFCTGVLVLLGSLNGPIHDLSDYYLFSAHMLQHLLLTLVFPPLILAGTPGWLLQPIFAHDRVRSVARALTRPVVAGLIFSLTMVIWHLPALYELMMRDHNVHIATHLLFIAAATIMWWPLLSPSPEVPRAQPGVQMLYLFLVGIPMQAVAAPISLADTVLYPWYAEAPRTWGLSALQDQQIGGLMMWVPAGLYLWAAIAIVFFVWSSKER